MTCMHVCMCVCVIHRCIYCTVYIYLTFTMKSMTQGGLNLFYVWLSSAAVAGLHYRKEEKMRLINRRHKKLAVKKKKGHVWKTLKQYTDVYKWQYRYQDNRNDWSTTTTCFSKSHTSTTLNNILCGFTICKNQ